MHRSRPGTGRASARKLTHARVRAAQRPATSYPRARPSIRARSRGIRSNAAKGSLHFTPSHFSLSPFFLPQPQPQPPPPPRARKNWKRARLPVGEEGATIANDISSYPLFALEEQQARPLICLHVIQSWRRRRRGKCIPEFAPLSRYPRGSCRAILLRHSWLDDSATWPCR